MTRALVYGDVNLNIIDGSAIWVQSMVEALSRCGVEVTVVLKAVVETDRLVAPISALPGVTVLRPLETRTQWRDRRTAMTPAQAIEVMTELDQAQPFDLVLMRGLRAVWAATRSGRFDGRLWTYLTDIPQTATAFDAETVERVGRIAESSRYMLCQTEELRSFLESIVPQACGRSVIWTPTVPAPEFELPQRAPLDGRPVRLVYTGKFAKRWNTREMTQLPALLAERGIDAELHLIGDKVQDAPDDPQWADSMRAALGTPGVDWRGGMPRQAAMEASASLDIGLSWRHPSMDGSLELSTKVLEFGALDVPVVLNRTSMHESLYGLDYPLFVQSAEDVVDVVAAAVTDPGVLELARERCAAVSERYSMDVAVGRMQALLDRAFPRAAQAAPELVGRPRRLRVGVASHDLKFFTRILDHLRGLPEVEVRVDEWPGLSKHDEAASRALVEWADVMIVEWCGPAAVWYSRHKRPGTRLVVRLHRFELDGAWLGDVEIGNVDQIVCVSPFYADLTRERTGWPAEKIVVVPNWVDAEQLDRPKLAGAEFALGFIGVAPMRKRMDLALDVLEALRREDDRFHLFAKTKLPWDYWWIWRRPEEQEHFLEVLRRIQTSPWLRGAVVFDGFGPDVPAWLRRIGWVLSTSDDESFHLAPAEGMASRAVPAILPWPGADTIYHPRWIDDGTDAMAGRILETVHGGTWAQEGEDARRHLVESFPLWTVCDSWTRLLVHDVEAPAVPPTLAPAD